MHPGRANNARLTLHWRPARWLGAQVEYDVAMNSKLKDAFLTLRTDLLSFRGGQFKPPFSVVAMDSRWDLPISDRGQLDFVLRDSMGIIGRRPGLQVGYQPRGGDTRAFLGVFRASSVRGDRIGDGSFNNFDDDWGLKLTGRVQHERKRLRLALSGDYRPAEPLPGEDDEHFWTLGADAAWRQKQRQGGWRLWGEGFLGSSWQDSNPFDGVNATFVGGQVIGAWRYGGRMDHAFYVEPYTLLSVFDPDTKVRDDILWEAAGGVNVGRWDQVRVTIEVQRCSAGVNTPPSLGFVFDDEPPFSRTGLVLQIGAVFEESVQNDMPEQLFDPGSPDFLSRTLTLRHALEVLARLLCALALGSLIAYRPWRRLPGNRSAAPQPDTAQAQTIIAVAGALLVIVIGDSLARAFGLVGLGTFIRFRAGIKDPRDVAVLFMMIGIGMACGLGLLGVATVGTLFVGCVLALFDRFGRAPRRRLTLSVIASDPGAIREVVLREYPDARVVDVRSATPERPERTTFVIPTNDDEDALAIYETLREKGATDIRAVRVEEQA